MDLVQSIRKDGSRGSAAIGDNVDVENIRNSNHRENYLGHSILAPVGRSERRRDQLFWARNNAAIDVEDEEIKQERKEAQIRERRALNEHLGRPIDEGIEELINGPKPAQPVVANPNLVAVGSSKDSKERKERRHKHHHRRHHRSRSRSPRRHHHRSHRSERDRSNSREDRGERRHRHRERSRSPRERRHRHDSERDRSRSPRERRHHYHESERHYSREEERRPQPRDRSNDRFQDDRPQRHRTREMSLERSRNDYIPRRDRDRDREDSFASERRPISRRGSFSHY